VQSCGGKRYKYSLDDIPIVIDFESNKRLPLQLPLPVIHIKYVTLETSRDCLIGTINKILIRNNRIYVSDFNQARSLFVFDLDGKYLFKISKIGKGPGEYISLHDFDIHTNGDIYIFDNHGWKFLVFNSAGEHLRDIKMNYSPSHFCLLEDKMYWSKLKEHGRMLANLSVYDMVKKRTDFLLTDKEFLYLIGMSYSSYDFYYSPNIIYYSPIFSEVIYSINDEGVFPAIGIKNLHKPPEHIVEKWLNTPVRELSDFLSNEIYFIENVHIYETDDHISICCISGVNSKILLYNKHTKETCSFFAFNLFDTIGRDRIMGSTGKCFFSVVNFNPENKIHYQILQSRKELEKWKEEDNPVVVFFVLDL